MKNSDKAGTSWPNLVPAKVEGLEILNIWEGGPRVAIILLEEVNATMGSEVILDLSSTLAKLKIPLVLSKIELNSESAQLLDKMKVQKKTSLLAVNKDYEIIENFGAVANSRESWYAAIKDFIWRKSSELWHLA